MGYRVLSISVVVVVSPSYNSRSGCLRIRNYSYKINWLGGPKVHRNPFVKLKEQWEGGDTSRAYYIMWELSIESGHDKGGWFRDNRGITATIHILVIGENPSIGGQTTADSPLMYALLPMVALFVIESIKWLANNEIIILYPGCELI